MGKRNPNQIWIQSNLYYYSWGEGQAEGEDTLRTHLRETALVGVSFPLTKRHLKFGWKCRVAVEVRREKVFT